MIVRTLLLVAVALAAGCEDPPPRPRTDPPGVRVFSGPQPPVVPPGNERRWRIEATAADTFPLSAIARAGGLRDVRWNGPASGNLIDAVLTSKAVTTVNLPEFTGTAEDLARLITHPPLRSLRVGGGPEWSDAVRDALRGSDLTHLHVIDTPLSGDDVAAVAAVDTLQSLYLDASPAPAAALEALRVQRPTLHFHRDSLHLPGDEHEGH